MVSWRNRHKERVFWGTEMISRMTKKDDEEAKSTCLCPSSQHRTQVLKVRNRERYPLNTSTPIEL